ncbi:hypothetical protein FOL47_006097, partial [Perkinsus chesapeaki]
VLQFLSENFDNGKDVSLPFEIDVGIDLGFEGDLNPSGVFPKADVGKKSGGDVDPFNEFPRPQLRRGNYFSAPDAVSAINSVIDEELHLGRIRELSLSEASHPERFFSRLAAVPKGKLASDGVTKLYRLVEDFKRS